MDAAGGSDSLLLRLVELGGPAAVMWFVLVRLERRLDENTRTVEKLVQQVAVLLDRGTRALETTSAAVNRLSEQTGRAEARAVQAERRHKRPSPPGPSEAR